MPLTTNAWSRFRQGDEQAFAFLIQRYAGVVRREVNRRARSDADREDLVQETWIRVWQKRQQFRGGDPQAASLAFGQWVRRLCMSACNQFERSFGRSPFTPELSGSADDGAAPLDERAQALDARDDAVVSAVLVLPPRQRAIIVYRIFLGYSTARTAGVLQCRPGTVQSGLHAAKRALRPVLARVLGAELNEF